jgi:hypothetical protein
MLSCILVFLSLANEAGIYLYQNCISINSLRAAAFLAFLFC